MANIRMIKTMSDEEAAARISRAFDLILNHKYKKPAPANSRQTMTGTGDQSPVNKHEPDKDSRK